MPIFHFDVAKYNVYSIKNNEILPHGFSRFMIKIRSYEYIGIPNIILVDKELEDDYFLIVFVS